MARKLIVLGLAALLGLAIAGVANARWFNVIRGEPDVVVNCEVVKTLPPTMHQARIRISV